MPFIDKISKFIDETLKAGTLNNAKLQPTTFHGLSTVVARKKLKAATAGQIELLPGIVTGKKIDAFIVPDNKVAMQLYHKVISNTYSLDKKGEGDLHYMKSSTELSLVVITNSKMTGKAKELLEPLVVFGMPQKLSQVLLADLLINNCLITVLSSNMDHVALFRQEYPQSDYFLNEAESMFSIRYKVEMTFSQRCVEQCLCD